MYVPCLTVFVKFVETIRNMFGCGCYFVVDCYEGALLDRPCMVFQRNTKYEIVYFKNMIKNKWQKNVNNQNKVNIFMLLRRLQNSNN